VRRGGWLALDKRIAKYLPKNRPYSRVEAMFSIQLDYDQENSVTVSGYANLWGWDRKTVRSFLDEAGITIEYPRDTQKCRNQQGLIRLHKDEGLRTKPGHIRLIDSRQLQGELSITRTIPPLIRDITMDTTMKLNPKKQRRENPSAHSRLFSDWFCYAFQVIQGYPYLFEGGKDGKILASILKATAWKELVAKTCHFLTDENRFPKDKAPTLSFLKMKINDYPPDVGDKVEIFRELVILPPKGVMLEEWKPWAAE